MNIQMSEDCNYTFSGRGGSFVFPVTFAKVSYPTRSGTRQPYVVLQDTFKDPSSVAWGSNTWTYFNISKDEYDRDVYEEVTNYHNATLEGFLASWAHTALPGFKKGTWSSASNVPGNYTIKSSGPSSFKLLSKDTGCMFTYRMDSGTFASWAAAVTVLQAATVHQGSFSEHRKVLRPTSVQCALLEPSATATTHAMSATWALPPWQLEQQAARPVRLPW
jgi:hypothetical protein